MSGQTKTSGGTWFGSNYILMTRELAHTRGGPIPTHTHTHRHTQHEAPWPKTKQRTYPKDLQTNKPQPNHEQTKTKTPHAHALTSHGEQPLYHIVHGIPVPVCGGAPFSRWPRKWGVWSSSLRCRRHSAGNVGCRTRKARQKSSPTAFAASGSLVRAQAKAARADLLCLALAHAAVPFPQNTLRLPHGSKLAGVPGVCPPSVFIVYQAVDISPFPPFSTTPLSRLDPCVCVFVSPAPATLDATVEHAQSRAVCVLDSVGSRESCSCRAPQILLVDGWIVSQSVWALRSSQHSGTQSKNKRQSATFGTPGNTCGAVVPVVRHRGRRVTSRGSCGIRMQKSRHLMTPPTAPNPLS